MLIGSVYFRGLLFLHLPLGLVSSFLVYMFIVFTFVWLICSVMHLVPAMRDVLQWMGGREVSKETIIHALRHEKQNLLIVPGGQAEMLESNSTINEVWY